MGEKETIQKTGIKEITPLPFILDFLQYRKGATSFTTIGTYDDIDSGGTD